MLTKFKLFWIFLFIEFCFNSSKTKYLLCQYRNNENMHTQINTVAINYDNLAMSSSNSLKSTMESSGSNNEQQKSRIFNMKTEKRNHKRRNSINISSNSLESVSDPSENSLHAIDKANTNHRFEYINCMKEKMITAIPDFSK